MDIKWTRFTISRNPKQRVLEDSWYTYIGIAEAWTLEATDEWKITRFDSDGNADHPNWQDNFDFTWTGVLGYTYS